MDILKSIIELDDDENVLEWTVRSEHENQRIDKYVTEAIADDVSRTQVQQWIKEGHVTVNHKTIKANYLVTLGDVVSVEIPAVTVLDSPPEAMELDVYYEDQDLIVINKPRGLVVHPAPGHYTGTLVNGLLHHCQDLSGINGVLRPGIVHRIDKDTSGLIVVAKQDRAHTHLAEQFRHHSVNRHYVAIVHGVVEHDQGTVEAPIGRDPHDRKRYTVIEHNSKSAITHFQVVERFNMYTLLELKLETGRTHQIRVHMKFIGHPLVGDPMYGKSKSIVMDKAGQALHAAVLGFIHPYDGRSMNFEAPLPAEMKQLLERIRS